MNGEGREVGEFVRTNQTTQRLIKRIHFNMENNKKKLGLHSKIILKNSLSKNRLIGSYFKIKYLTLFNGGI